MGFLQVSGLSIRFGGIVALDSVSFDVTRGHIVGLIGPNGAGKTTVFNLVTRIFDPDDGEIVFDGTRILGLHPYQVIHHGIARTFQNVELFRTMTVRENIAMGHHSTQRASLVETAFGLPRARQERAAALRRAGEMIEMFGLGPYADVEAAGLPYGLKKRTEIARALVSNPRLLLLDEPASGLNHQELEDLAGLIRAIRNDLGVTVVLVEHHMGLVMEISDHICVLDFGKKIAEGTPLEVRHNPQVIEAYLGEPADAPA